MTRLHALATEVRNPNSSISVFMRERFPHLSGIQAEFRGQVASLPTIRPDPGAGTPPYATIGAAVDYRLRYYFRKTIIQTMDAFRGATYAISLRDGAMGEYVSVPMYGAEVAKDLDQRVPVPRVASDFFDSLETLVEQVNPTRRILKPEDELRLSRYCYILALFEQVMRSNRRRTGQSEGQSPLQNLKTGATLDELLALPADAWVKDIGRMAWLFGKRHSKLFFAKVKVNPAHLSSWYGFGADADLLVNGYIMDIKSALHPVLEPAWLYQVLGYTLLDHRDSKGIQGVGFYLARQGVFVQWPLETLLPRLTGRSNVSLEQLRRDFTGALPV